MIRWGSVRACSSAGVGDSGTFVTQASDSIDVEYACACVFECRCRWQRNFRFAGKRLDRRGVWVCMCVLRAGSRSRNGQRDFRRAECSGACATQRYCSLAEWVSGQRGEGRLLGFRLLEVSLKAEASRMNHNASRSLFYSSSRRSCMRWHEQWRGLLRESMH